MNRPQNRRRGVVIGVAALAGLATAALGVVGVAQHAGLTAQQQDIALVNAADDAHNALIAAQVAQDHSLFNNDFASQEAIYWAAESKFQAGHGLDPSKWLFPGDPTDPQDSIYNGAISRFDEAQLVSQAIHQVKLDHLLGVNQTLGAGGYEGEIGNALNSDLSATVPATGALHDDLAALMVPGTQESFSGFSAALTTLHTDLLHTAFSDLLGIFTLHAADAGSAAADVVSTIDLP
ncbi:MAG TPA: hypothetical protein VFQ37_03285 [Mycobacterium sp.]|nr:hypothetical protein [Mycobacterium sp.]